MSTKLRIIKFSYKRAADWHAIKEVIMHEIYEIEEFVSSLHLYDDLFLSGGDLSMAG